MEGALESPWRNLRICQVVDAGSVWVREVPSSTCSEELLQFLEMEKLMNHHFSNKLPQDATDHSSCVRVGNLVVVRYNDCWARGRAEEALDASGEKMVVFLLDYGITIVAEVLTIIPISSKEWASVPYQARKISLFGVTPASLQYSFIDQEVKMVLKHSKLWDSSATEYVRLLSSKTPQVEFTPRISQKGCLYGNLLVILPKETWASIIPELSKSHWVQREDSHMAIDLAKLLIDCEFAELWKDDENFNSGSPFDSGQTHLNKRHFRGYCPCPHNTETSGGTVKQKCVRESLRETLREISTTSSEHDEEDIVVTDGKLTSPCRKLKPSTTKETTDSCVCLKTDAKKQAESGRIASSQKKSMELKSYACDLSSNNENLSLRLMNNKSKLSSTGVTFPLLKGLASEHHGLSRHSIFSSCMFKQKFDSEVSKHNENTKMSKDESIRREIYNKEVNQNELNRSTLVAGLCKDIEKDSILEKTAEDNTIDAAKSLKLLAEDYISSRVSHEPPEKFNLSKIPQWVCTSLVGAVWDQEIAEQRNYSHKDDILSEGKNFETIEGKQMPAKTYADSIENLRHRKEMLATVKEKEEVKNSEFQNNSTSAKNMFHTLDRKDFFREVLTNHHATGLNEMDTTVTKQHSRHSISKVARTYRVFVAGGPHTLHEEALINKDILHTTLNSHIAKVLCKNDINATLVQAYTWPALIRGGSAVIVGEKACGKTLGYVVPLLSTILDTHQHISHRLPPGIGPLMVMVFSTWQSVRCAADHVDSLLPADTTLRIITTWGGCGVEEEMSMRKQLLGGCDILLTTAPCLIRLLSGDTTLQAGGPEGAITTLTRCCHLVIDEADVVLRNFSLEVKQIITMWGEERKKCSRPDLEFQAVLVSSKWTKSVSQLTHILLLLLDPTIIISSPYEAAIATKVGNHICHVNNEAEAYDMVMNLIASSYSQKKNMVFVKSDSGADLLGSMMKNVAIYCLVANNTVCMNRLQQLVHEWHIMGGVTMIVSEKLEPSLLYHDLADAQTIFHTHIGSSWTTFSQRYGFMVDNFVCDLQQKSVDCESYIIVPQFSHSRTPKAWNELSRFCGKTTEEMKVDLLSTQEGLSEDTAICYYLKAYGSCFEESSCKFRHKFHSSDMGHKIPKAGKVTFKVMKVLNASRFFVHLVEYQEKSDGQSIDLTSHYHIIKSALHQHYADASHHQPLSYVEKGTLCAVKDSGHWSRAKVVSVNYSKATTVLEVFLIDEGKEITLNLSSALFLPLHLAKFPQLIVEVFLCCIKPLDEDREWTPQATNFVCKVFAKNKKSKFVGMITLALGHTMWMNPVVELSKIGKNYIQRKSLRGKLLSGKFGMDNPNHLKVFEELCSLSHMPFRHEDVFSHSWIEARNEALQKVQIAGNTDNHNTDTLTNDKIASEMEEAVQNKESIIHDDLSSRNSCLNTSEICEAKVFSQLEAEDKMTVNSGISLTSQILAHEELPLDTEVRVHIAEVVSPEEFYVIREDRLQELDALETEIDNVHDFLEYCEGERSSCDHSFVKSSEFKPSLGVLCIAKFTDEKYYRGQVTGGDPDGSLLIFFIDHGETIDVPSCQVHACPRIWVESLPGQAILCSLAHLSIPPPLRQEAKQAMLHLADITESWIVKALEVIDESGPLYVVELKDKTSNPQVEMYKELIHQGLALLDTEMVPSDGEETSVFLNTSNIDTQEIEDFFHGLSAVNQEKTKETNNLKPEVHIKCRKTDKETKQKDIIPPEVHIKCKKTDKETKQKDIIPPEVHIKCKKTDKETKQKDIIPPDSASKSEANCAYKSVEEYSSHNSLTGRNVSNRRPLRVPPLSAVDGVTRRLFPETSWSQEEDRINITVHLVGVEQYKCCVNASHFTFMCALGDKFYVLDEELSHEVITDSTLVSILGICASITIKKAIEGEWIHLFKDRRHRPWLRGNYEKLSSGNSSESEYYDDGWRECFRNDKELPMGGLPAGISDTDGISDTEDSENTD